VFSAQHAKQVHSSLSTGVEFPNFLLAVFGSLELKTKRNGFNKRNDCERIEPKSFWKSIRKVPGKCTIFKKKLSFWQFFKQF
jgi:hypothetical protein